MKSKKLELSIISIKNTELLDKISKNQYFKSYLKNNKELSSDFTALLEKRKSRFTYCVCSLGDKLLSLIITADLSKDTPDYMTSFVEEEKKTLWMDLIFLCKPDVKLEEAVEWLSAFISSCPKEIGALIADPEVKQEFSIALYEMAGFTRVSTFIKGQGFFKGTSHYMMKLKI